jgi:ABC-type glycerol-3-phosphate transport system substrate-binding protein
VKKFRPFIICHLAFVILLTACIAAPPTVAPTVAVPRAGTPTPTSVLENSTPQPAVTPSGTEQVLRLWLPPQFSPTEDTPGAEAMQAQIDAFEESTGWQVEVRIKKLIGQGSLLDHLRTSLQIAPSVSPDVIALDSAMLVSGINYIQPLSQIADDELTDYYSFALQGARIGETLVALPFAADAFGFAYSTSAYGVPPRAWTDMLVENGPVWLPLSDPSALVTLQQYVAMGGALTDETGQPTLNATLLAQVLADYQTMQIDGLLPAESFGAPSIESTWITYRESRATAAAALFSDYLMDRRRVGSTSFTFIPSHTGTSLTFTRQWNYALVTTDPTRQTAALELMRWLTAPDNAGAWSMAANALPTRSQALAAWNDPSLAAMADRLLNAAQPEPPPAILAVVGPPITAAIQSVLNGQASPEAAATTAANAVAGR